MYSVKDIIVSANAETAAAVGVGGVTMEFTQAEVGDATPTNLRCAVEAGNHLSAIVRWSRLQSPGNDPLPWHAETIPAATLAPGWPGAAGDTHAIAFATTAPPATRFEGLAQMIARVDAIESAFTEVARVKARTADSVVQLTPSVAALVQHTGIIPALAPAPPPASPSRTFAAIAGAPAPAYDAALASGLALSWISQPRAQPPRAQLPPRPPRGTAW